MQLFANKYQNRSSRKDFDESGLSLFSTYVNIDDNFNSLALCDLYRLHLRRLIPLFAWTFVWKNNIICCDNVICVWHSFDIITYNNICLNSIFKRIFAITVQCIRCSAKFLKISKIFMYVKCLFKTIGLSLMRFGKLCEIFGLVVSGRLDTIEGKHQPVND